MARPAGRRRRSEPSAPSAGRRVAAECVGLALVGLSLLAAIGLVGAEPGGQGVAQRAGVVGAALTAMLFGAFGYGAAVAVGASAWIGVRLVLQRGLPPATSRFWVGGPLLLLSAAAIPPLADAAFAASPLPAAGGRLGGWLAGRALWLAGGAGGLVLAGLAFATGILFLFGVSTASALRGVGRVLSFAGVVLAGAAVAGARAAFRTFHAIGSGALALAERLGGAMRRVSVWRERRARRGRVAAYREEVQPAAPESAAAEAGAGGVLRRAARAAAPTIVDHAAERGEAPRQETFRFSESAPKGDYRLPDIDVFERPPVGSRRYDRDSLIMNSRILEKKLKDFGVTGRVVKVHPGPVVTMYEFEPASGVKVNRIVSLSDDLSLALRALSVRIIAPLPGTSVVGIEVANPEREIVYIRELLEVEPPQKGASKLTIALGKDIFGNPVHADLTRMPHLLVAGATGTGKSVFLNTLLCSILCRATPDDLKLLLIDPKLLELSVYEGIPHLLADVVTNPKRAAAALQGVVHKMEERYQLMAALGVRSIAQYNERVEKELAAGKETFRLRPASGEEEGQEVPFRRLPYICVVIDELADLMVVSAREVEESLQRLAQMARAAGIHLVLATQRPSVDVLTGIIKANFPARVSFQVSSRTDSRTILDQNGADHLLGQGDMLFLPPGTSKLQRIHGAYVSEEEVADLVASLREQGTPEFDDTLVRLREESEARESRGEDVDDMYDRAIEIVAESRRASISHLQRRLKVGYNRAARMIEQMEADGIVSAADGVKGREVLAPQRTYE